MPAATGSRTQAGQLRVSELCSDTRFNVIRNGGARLNRFKLFNRTAPFSGFLSRSKKFLHLSESVSLKIITANALAFLQLYFSRSRDQLCFASEKRYKKRNF